MTWPRLSDRQVLALLVAFAVLLGIGTYLWPDIDPVSALTIPVVIGGWRLSRRSMLVLGTVVVIVLAFEVLMSPVARTMVAAGVVLAMVGLSYRYAWLRERWGLSATTGMQILLDVRDRVRAQGDPPELKPGWHMARALRSARGAAFRGDFTLAHRRGPLVQAMVVDVSGHGLAVATRSMQLAGAFGGLIGVVPPDALLRACHDYLADQDWDRDYATAIHLVVDMDSATAEVRCAGHPPAQVRRVDGRWESVPAGGPILGLHPDPRFPPAQVVLEPGDLVVLASDGVLDERAEDPWAALRTAVGRWVARGHPDIADRELDTVRPATADDQAVVVVRRDSPR